MAIAKIVQLTGAENENICPVVTQDCILNADGTTGLNAATLNGSTKAEIIAEVVQSSIDIDGGTF